MHCRWRQTGVRFASWPFSPDWKYPLEFQFQVVLNNLGHDYTISKLPPVQKILHECVCCDRGLTFFTCARPMDLGTQAKKKRERCN